MLKRYEDAMRAAAALVSGVDRDVRRKLVRVTGREERYTEKFVMLIDERLNGFAEGGIDWKVVTHVNDKQSGQEKRLGSDLLICLNLSFDNIAVRKGIQAQAKVNKNTKFGLSVDSKSRLKEQCETMLLHTPESYVFAYGDQGTKIVKAGAMLDALPGSMTGLVTQSTEDFFYDFFVCRAGDREVVADDEAALQGLAKEMEAAAGVLVTAAPIKPRVRKRPAST